jgi:hypothetical protein
MSRALIIGLGGCPRIRLSNEQLLVGFGEI